MNHPVRVVNHSVFGNIKQNKEFERFRLRGIEKVNIEDGLLALARNLQRFSNPHDRGVIAILDPSLRTKPYGRDFLTSLPRMRITSELSDVASIFDFNANGAI